jgi:hypothetical protein
LSVFTASGPGLLQAAAAVSTLWFGATIGYSNPRVAAKVDRFAETDNDRQTEFPEP